MVVDLQPTLVDPVLGESFAEIWIKILARGNTQVRGRASGGCRRTATDTGDLQQTTQPTHSSRVSIPSHTPNNPVYWCSAAPLYRSLRDDPSTDFRWRPLPLLPSQLPRPQPRPRPCRPPPPLMPPPVSRSPAPRSVGGPPKLRGAAAAASRAMPRRLSCS